MSHVKAKAITIRCENLGEDVQLVLTFDKEKVIPSRRMFEDVFPTAWRVTTFPKTGSHRFDVKYESRLVFTKPQVIGDIAQPAATHSKEIVNGQSTTLSSTLIGGVPSFWFSDLTTGKPGVIQAYNASESFADIGVGIVESGVKDPTTVLLWKKIGHDGGVAVPFTPIVSAYVVRESTFRSGQLIKRAIISDLKWSQNLNVLREKTNWILHRNPNTGMFSLVEDDTRRA